MQCPGVPRKICVADQNWAKIGSNFVKAKFGLKCKLYVTGEGGVQVWGVVLYLIFNAASFGLF